MRSSKTLQCNHGFGERGDTFLTFVFPLRFSSLCEARGHGVQAGQGLGGV